MASFQAKIGCKTERKRENKNCRFVRFRFCPTCNRKQFKKIAKQFKNTIMASFQAKIDWKMPRKREYIEYRSVSFQPDA